MKQPMLYDNFFYSSYTLSIENLSLTVTLDGGVYDSSVRLTPLHSHPVFELQTVLAGKLLLTTTDGKELIIGEDELCLLPPDFYHGVQPLEETHRMTLRFSIQRLADTEVDLHSRFAKLTDATHIQDGGAILCALSRIRAEILSPTATTGALCRAYLSELFLLLFRSLGAKDENMTAPQLSESDDENARYNKIELLMQQHMADIFREEDLAEALGLSVRQTSRMMQKIFGMSFRKKLLELRLHYAKGLLLTTEIPVEQIAATVGYTSPSGFHIAFKKAFGSTPSDYRDANLPASFNSGT